MVLAAGKGERMRPLTLEKPKPLLEAGGKSLIRHQLEKLAAAGIHECVINHAWLGEQLEAALGSGESLGMSISWSPEGEPLETAGGIIQALPQLQENAPGAFICVNADIWTDYPYARLPEVDGRELLAWLVLVDNPVQHPAGDFVLESDYVREPESNDTALTFSGIAVYHPAFFAGTTPGRQPLLPLLKKAMAAGKVGGEYYPGKWYDIGTPERLAALDALLGKTA